MFQTQPQLTKGGRRCRKIFDRALRLIKIEREEPPFILDMEQLLKPDAPKIMGEVVRMNQAAKEPNTLLTRTMQSWAWAGAQPKKKYIARAPGSG